MLCPSPFKWTIFVKWSCRKGLFSSDVSWFQCLEKSRKQVHQCVICVILHNTVVAYFFPDIEIRIHKRKPVILEPFQITDIFWKWLIGKVRNLEFIFWRPHGIVIFIRGEPMLPFPEPRYKLEQWPTGGTDLQIQISPPLASWLKTHPLRYQ